MYGPCLAHSLGVVFPRCIRAIAWARASPLFAADWYSVPWTDGLVPMRSSVAGRLACDSFLAVVDDVAENIRVPVFAWTPAFSSLGCAWQWRGWITRELLTWPRPRTSHSPSDSWVSRPRPLPSARDCCCSEPPTGRFCRAGLVIWTECCGLALRLAPFTPSGTWPRARVSPHMHVFGTHRLLNNVNCLCTCESHVTSPGRCGWVGWSIVLQPKGCGFNSLSGSIREAADQSFSLASMHLSLLSSLPFSLSKRQ